MPVTLQGLFDDRWKAEVMRRKPLACASCIVIERDGVLYRYHEGHNSGKEKTPEIAPTWWRIE